MNKNKLVLVIMDGIGISNESYGNAVKNAKTPNLDKLMNNYPNTLIKAHGSYVGLSEKDMGNSEVGHNALGCGQIYSQGIKLVDKSIMTKKIFSTETWKNLVSFCKDKGKMHFIGLLSDGRVHSNIYHLFELIKRAKAEKIKEVRIHILLDGRDVEERSALKYINMLDDLLKELNDDSFNAKIASGGGRMVITMDRYEADWSMVELGWKTHVLGIGNKYKTAQEAILDCRCKKNVIDQYLDPFVIVDDNNNPVGTINDNDSVILFNYRGDRAVEISKCFDDESFNKFDRIKVPKVMYAGMMEYDSDFRIPKNFLTNPPDIENTLTEELCKYNIKEYAISETEKYGHITYFWNGNKLEKFDNHLETFEKIKGDKIPFELQPKMKSKEITDRLIEVIESNKYDFLRVNYPNGDMVGHTGKYEATIEAVEAVDTSIGRIMESALKNNYLLMVIADHGNAEEMYQLKDKTKNISKTSHTTNPVPFIIYGNNVSDFRIKEGDFGLANVASSIVDILGIEKNPLWKESIIERIK